MNTLSLEGHLMRDIFANSREPADELIDERRDGPPRRRYRRERPQRLAAHSKAAKPLADMVPAMAPMPRDTPCASPRTTPLRPSIAREMRHRRHGPILFSI